MTIARPALRLAALALPLLALAACTMDNDIRPTSPPRTPAATVTAMPTPVSPTTASASVSPAAAAADEARSGMVQGTLQRPL